MSVWVSTRRTLAVLQRVEQEVVGDLLSREPIDRLLITEMAGEGLKEQRHRRESLLTVDDEQRSLAGDLGEPLSDVDDRTNEVSSLRRCGLLS